MAKVLSYHNNSVPKALSELFPEIGIAPQKFSSLGMSISFLYFFSSLPHISFNRSHSLSQHRGVAFEAGGGFSKNLQTKGDLNPVSRTIGILRSYTSFLATRYKEKKNTVNNERLTLIRVLRRLFPTIRTAWQTLSLIYFLILDWTNQNWLLCVCFMLYVILLSPYLSISYIPSVPSSLISSFTRCSFLSCSY